MSGASANASARRRRAAPDNSQTVLQRSSNLQQRPIREEVTNNTDTNNTLPNNTGTPLQILKLHDFKIKEIEESLDEKILSISRQIAEEVLFNNIEIDNSNDNYNDNNKDNNDLFDNINSLQAKIENVNFDELLSFKSKFENDSSYNNTLLEKLDNRLQKLEDDINSFDSNKNSTNLSDNKIDTEISKLSKRITMLDTLFNSTKNKNLDMNINKLDELKKMHNDLSNKVDNNISKNNNDLELDRNNFNKKTIELNEMRDEIKSLKVDIKKM